MENFQSWLAREFRDDSIRILAVDYTSKLLEFGELVDNVEQRSKKLKADLEKAGVGSRPVVFIAHCEFY